MSLVSTYVQSQEGHWYKNPTVRGDGWFICWDDDEPIELVIKDEKGGELNRILSNLANDGWSLKIWYKGYECSRIFGEEFQPAQAYFIRQHNRGPTDAMLAGSERLDTEPQRQGVFYFDGPDGHRIR